MEKKNYNEEFLELLKKNNNSNSYSNRQLNNNGTKITISGITIEEHIIIDKSIGDIEFTACTFKDVKFHNCGLSETSFTICNFYNCAFYTSYFEYVNFTSCYIINTRIDSCQFDKCTFSDTIITESYKFSNSELNRIYNAINFTSFNECNYYQTSIIDAEIFNTNFVGINKEVLPVLTELTIRRTRLTKNVFSDIDLTDSVLTECEIINTSFINTLLTQKTLNNIKQTENSSCFIDLQTILKSDINEETFKLFGVHGFDPKGYIKDLVTEMKFQSVFISYSFEDKEFARALSHILMTRGIKSFFWERDAPGGRRLKKIMYENIHSHDRLLFIASKNSLKSEACHYELNEAREKQNKEWKDIYFPIHIDSYLFEVHKEDIPRKHRDAFWENIEEVKEFNSKDFSSFKTKEDYKSKEFEEAVVQLIKDLKL
ncbi:MAG: toll/interleukin-1 receptor domain-containing protein [Flavipsychrobacter sp.]